MVHFITMPFLSEELALPIMLLNVTVYLLTCFAAIHFVSRQEKTKGNLLFGGIGLILLGVFAAGFSATTILSLQGLIAGNHDHLAAFGNLLQNIYLYVSAAIGGGIAGAAVFAPEDNSLPPVKPAQAKPATTKAKAGGKPQQSKGRHG
ncbi:hypothetical protein CEK28_04865 [Xenophilus sp. AP218F]|nr:hypothetical protein CEK28_04865 [Xenophilus sp. AP218F]